MGRSEEPNMGLPHIGKSVYCELFLLGYRILQMAQRKKWDSESMKAAIEAMRNTEMRSYKAFRVFSVSKKHRSVMLKIGRKAQVKQ